MGSGGRSDTDGAVRAIARRMLGDLPAGCDARHIARRMGLEVRPHRGATYVRDGVLVFNDRQSTRERDLRVRGALAVYELGRSDTAANTPANVTALTVALGGGSSSGTWARIA